MGLRGRSHCVTNVSQEGGGGVGKEWPLFDEH